MWGGPYLRAQFQRLKSRRGPKKAVVVVAASMLAAMYSMLRDGVEYRELGVDYFERRDKQKVLKLRPQVGPTPHSPWKRW